MTAANDAPTLPPPIRLPRRSSPARDARAFRRRRREHLTGRALLELPTLLCALGLLASSVPGIARAGGDAAEGKKTYDVLCRVCHGATGGGDGPASAGIDPPPRNFTLGRFMFDADKDGVTGTDEDLHIVITRGGAAFGGNPVMVPWTQLSDAEVGHLIAYIRSLEAARTTRK